MSQPDINSLILGLLLLAVLYYVSNFRKKIKIFFSKEKELPTQYFLNTQARLRAIEFAPNALITIDIDGFIVAWNGGARNLFGYSELEVLGKPLTLIIPDKYKKRHIEGIKRLRSKGHSNIIGKTLEMTGLDRSLKEFPIELTLWSWVEGSHTFYTGIIRDLTKEKQIEKFNEEILDVYKKGEEIDCTGTWSWDILSDRVLVTAGFSKLFNIDVNEVNSDYLLSREGYDNMRYRVVNKNGTFTNVLVKGKAYLDDNGELINLTGTIHEL